MTRPHGLALALLLVTPAAAAQTDPPSPPAARAVDEGIPAEGEIRIGDEVAEGTTVRRAISRFVVVAPVASVASVMTDFGRYTEILPRLTESRIVRRTRAGTEVYLQVSLSPSPGFLWSRMRLQVRRGAERVEIVGASLEGNLDRFDFVTRLETVPGDPTRTLVTCRMLTIPQLPFPSSVFTRENRDALGTFANHLRARVASLTPPAPASPPPAATASATGAARPS